MSRKIKLTKNPQFKILYSSSTIISTVVPMLKLQLRYAGVGSDEIENLFEALTPKGARKSSDRTESIACPKKTKPAANGVKTGRTKTRRAKNKTRLAPGQKYQIKKISRISSPLHSQFGFKIYFYLNVNTNLDNIKNISNYLADKKNRAKDRYDKLLIISDRKHVAKDDLYRVHYIDIYFREIKFYLYNLFGPVTQVKIPKNYPAEISDGPFTFDIVRTIDPNHSAVYSKYKDQVSKLLYNDPLSMFFMLAVNDIMLYTKVINETFTIQMRIVVPAEIRINKKI